MTITGNHQQKPLVVLIGPTAVGKSRIAIPLAQALKTEILTADSRQVYGEWISGWTSRVWTSVAASCIGSLISSNRTSRLMSVSFAAWLSMRLPDCTRTAGYHSMVGGTGLYVRAIVRGLWEGPPADWDYRHRLAAVAERDGTEPLYRELAQIDPELAARLHPRDVIKIIRGLETYHVTGRRLSELHREHGFAEHPFSSLLIGLTRDRQALYRRVEARVDAQLAAGLVEETRRLLAQGYGRHLGSMKGLGYRQMSGYLAGEYSYEEAVRLLKRDTRHFAKRQYTWFRKEPGIVWVEMEEDESVDSTVSKLVGMVQGFLSQGIDRDGSQVQSAILMAGS